MLIHSTNLQISIKSICFNLNFLLDNQKMCSGREWSIVWVVDEECEGRMEDLAQPCNLFCASTADTL
jgi:hypothetical protein